MTQSTSPDAPGEILHKKGYIEGNKGRKTKIVIVVNNGDRPVQVGSHFHFFEVNKALRFPREKAYGMRLNIPAGTAVRFEPGEEKEVELTEIGGNKIVRGLNRLTSGKLDSLESALEKAKKKGFQGVGDK